MDRVRGDDAVHRARHRGTRRRGPEITPWNMLAIYGAGIVWVYMLMVWIVVCVQTYFAIVHY